MRLRWQPPVLELIMAFALNRIEGFVSAEPVPYIIKYLITPVTINCVLVLVGMLAMKSRWLSRQTRQTMVSLCMAGVCLVLYGVHSLFPALILLPVVAIMLTTSYGDYRLTSITGRRVPVGGTGGGLAGGVGFHPASPAGKYGKSNQLAVEHRDAAGVLSAVSGIHLL